MMNWFIVLGVVGAVTLTAILFSVTRADTRHRANENTISA